MIGLIVMVWIMIGVGAHLVWCDRFERRYGEAPAGWLPMCLVAAIAGPTLLVLMIDDDP